MKHAENFVERVERANREGMRRVLGKHTPVEDLVAAFRVHNLVEPRDVSRPPIVEIVKASDADLRRWYVARVDTMAPGKVEAEIRRKGVSTYHPRVTKWHAIKNPKPGKPRKRAVTSSLFVGYVFAGFLAASDRGFGALRGVAGFHGFIAANGSPIEISAANVASIMSDEEAGLYDETLQKPSRFPVGRSVRFTSGPFAGMAGHISQLKSEERVKVLLSLLGSVSAVVVPVDQLEPVGG